MDRRAGRQEIVISEESQDTDRLVDRAELLERQRKALRRGMIEAIASLGLGLGLACASQNGAPAGRSCGISRRGRAHPQRSAVHAWGGRPRISERQQGAIVLREEKERVRAKISTDEEGSPTVAVYDPKAMSSRRRGERSPPVRMVLSEDVT